MAKSDIESMSVKELRELRQRIDAAIIERQKADRIALKAQMQALAEEAGLSLDDVLGAGKRRGKGGTVAPKYRNPDNPDETWAGRGRMPLWLNEKLAKRGAKLEDFAI